MSDSEVSSHFLVASVYNWDGMGTASVIFYAESDTLLHGPNMRLWTKEATSRGTRLLLTFGHRSVNFATGVT